VEAIVESFGAYITEGRKFGTIVFVDIDDTLFTTGARVRVRNVKTGEVRDLSPAEYNTWKPSDLEQPDFGEFRSGKVFRDTAKAIAPTLKIVKAHIKAGDGVVFLTARAGFDDNAMVRAVFREHGIRMSGKNVFTELTGNLDSKISGVEPRKAYVVSKFIGRYQPERVEMYDDHRANVSAFLDLQGEHPDVDFGAYLVVKGKPRRIW
jgi:hypothetical protein